MSLDNWNVTKITTGGYNITNVVLTVEVFKDQSCEVTNEAGDFLAVDNIHDLIDAVRVLAKTMGITARS